MLPTVLPMATPKDSVSPGLKLLKVSVSVLPVKWAPGARLEIALVKVGTGPLGAVAFPGVTGYAPVKNRKLIGVRSNVRLVNCVPFGPV